MRNIRRAEPQEYELLSDLALRAKAYWGYSDDFMDACRAELTYTVSDIQRDSFYVVLEGNTPVGFYGLVKESDSVYELEALFIEPAYIGQGYGCLLMEHAKRTAKQSGGIELRIQGDPNAAAFYFKVGGRRIGERESDSIAGRYLPLFSVQLVEPDDNA